MSINQNSKFVINQHLRQISAALVVVALGMVSSFADSQPKALEILFLVKHREAELSREIDSLRFRVIETTEELSEEGEVEDMEKEVREAVQGAGQNPAARELERSKVAGSKQEGSGSFSILASSSLFDWRVGREEVLDGVPCMVLEFQPSGEARPRNQREEVMSQMQGRYWVNQADNSCMRIEGKLTRLVPILGFFAELREVEFSWHAQKLEGELVAPKQVQYRYKASVFPFLTTHERHTLSYEAIP
ncbi:MAG: hypothetical protein EBS53_08810 [Bacteroidetes bacterium]|nr:hypothetical protein [Bacteroidota bacterium]